MARIIIENIRICISNETRDELPQNGNGEYLVKFNTNGRSKKLLFKVEFDVNNPTPNLVADFVALMGNLTEYDLVDSEEGVIYYNDSQVHNLSVMYFPFQLRIVKNNTTMAAPISIKAKVHGSTNPHSKQVWFKRSIQ